MTSAGRDSRRLLYKSLRNWAKTVIGWGKKEAAVLG